MLKSRAGVRSGPTILGAPTKGASDWHGPSLESHWHTPVSLSTSVGYYMQSRQPLRSCICLCTHFCSDSGYSLKQLNQRAPADRGFCTPSPHNLTPQSQTTPKQVRGKLFTTIHIYAHHLLPYSHTVYRASLDTFFAQRLPHTDPHSL